MTHRFFTEYRDKDYRTPRSMKEAYGWDAPLFVETRDSLSDFCGWLLLTACAGLVVWFAYGWIK